MKVHFASLTDICHRKNSGSYAVFTEQGSSASQMTTAKIMDIISRLPGCAGQAADAVSGYTQVKMDDAPKWLRIPNSECPDIWIRPPRQKWPVSLSSMEDPVVPLERNLCGHPLAGLSWERRFEKILLEDDWGKLQTGNAYSCTDRKDHSYLCTWMTSNWLARKKTFIRCGRYSTKKHHSLIMYIWNVLKDIAKHANIWLKITESSSNKGFPQEQRKNYQARKIRMFVPGPTTWKVMPRSEWNDIANWRTKPLSNYTKCRLHALMTINVKKKN